MNLELKIGEELILKKRNMLIKGLTYAGKGEQGVDLFKKEDGIYFLSLEKGEFVFRNYRGKK